MYSLIWQKLQAAVTPRDVVSEGSVSPGASASRLVPGSVQGNRDQVVLLIVLGLDDVLTSAVVEQIGTQKDLPDHTPVFFTDLDRFDLFADRGYVFEHIPSPRSRSLAPADLPWDHYLNRRLDLLQTKWRPVATIPFGEVACAALATWRKANDTAISAGKIERRSYSDLVKGAGE